VSVPASDFGFSIVVGLSDGVIEELVEYVTERVLADLRADRTDGRWITGAAGAAEYLGCSVKRVYNRLHEIPHARDGGRLVFNTADLDAWLRGSQ
jgi:excisionase family DNA binding protein